MKHKSRTIPNFGLVFALTSVLVLLGLNPLDVAARPGIDKPDKPDKVPPGEPDWQVAIPHVTSDFGSHVYGQSKNVDEPYAIYDYYGNGDVDVRFVQNPPGWINLARNVLQLWISDESPTDYYICMGSTSDQTGCSSPLPMSTIGCNDPFCYTSSTCIFPEGLCMSDFLMKPQPDLDYYALMAFRTDIEIEDDLPPDSTTTADGEFAFYVRYRGGYNKEGVEELHSIRCTVPATITRTSDNEWTTTTKDQAILECWEYYEERTGKGKVQAMTRIAEMTTSEPFAFKAIWTKLN